MITGNQNEPTTMPSAYCYRTRKNKHPYIHHNAGEQRGRSLAVSGNKQE